MGKSNLFPRLWSTGEKPEDSKCSELKGTHSLNPYAVCRMPYAVCRMPYAVCHMASVVCRIPYAVCRQPYAICRIPYTVYRIQYALFPQTVFCIPHQFFEILVGSCYIAYYCWQFYSSHIYWRGTRLKTLSSKIVWACNDSHNPFTPVAITTIFSIDNAALFLLTEIESFVNFSEVN